jgi:threonine aldolase
MHDVVDLRSDTLTLPTAEMREAMARAEVGDDVWEEDPTVKRLEALAAERLGQAAGLFVTSGTQGNLVSVLAQTRPGDEVVLDLDAHIFNYEVGGAAVIGGVQMRPVRTARGFLTPEQVREALRPANIHIPRTGLVCVENTHNRHGGTCCTPEEIGAVAAAARAAGVPVHLDGARLFNAAVALGRDARDFTGHVDSVTFCLSKGLGAPVGSVVCGSADFIARARRVRKMLGGGMRQAGVLAAAGLVALERMVGRLAEDHAHARRLAEGLGRLPGLRLDLDTVQTNIVIVRVAGPAGGDAARATAALVAGCAARKIKVHAMGPTAIRCVTHKDVDGEDIDRALAAFAELTNPWARSGGGRQRSGPQARGASEGG